MLYIISHVTTILTAALFVVTIGYFYKPFLLSGALTVAMWCAIVGVRMALEWAQVWEGQRLGFPPLPSARTAGQIALFAGLLVLQPAGLGTECPQNVVCQMTLLPATESQNGQENTKKYLRQEKGRR